MKRSFWDTAELYLSKELVKEGSTQAPESDINIHRSVVVACLVKPADLKAAAAAHAAPLRRRGIQTLTLFLDLILNMYKVEHEMVPIWKNDPGNVTNPAEARISSIS